VSIADLGRHLSERLGSGAVLDGADAAGRLVGWTVSQPLGAGLLVRPADTDGVATTLAACHAAGIGVVPLGGGTGLVDGVAATGDLVAISLERLRTIHEVDADDRVLIADAGVTLGAAQRAAAASGLEVGIDLGARDSAQLGGLVATNAGGNGVIRHGMTGDRVLGLEVVLADGTVIPGLRRIVKDNTGYDLSGLFVGSEGTLGVITKVALRCTPLPAGRLTALVAVVSFDAVVAILRDLQVRTAGAVAAFEVMWHSFYQAVAVESGQHRAPLPPDAPFYVLVEVETGTSDPGPEMLAHLLDDAMGAGHVLDAVVPHTAADREALWAIRDDIPALTEVLGGRFAYDISLPIGTMEAYLEELSRRLATRCGSRLVVFGHLGDGNLHLSIGGLQGSERPAIDDLVYAPLSELGGSISAEHGIGRSRSPHLHLSRSPEEIALMRTLKWALDPKGILNPGVIFG